MGFEKFGKWGTAGLAALLIAGGTAAYSPAGTIPDSSGLLKLMDAETPLIADLKYLTSEIGGRPTGSEANEKALDWISSQLKKAGFEPIIQTFKLPRSWAAGEASAQIVGQTITVTPTLVPRVYSARTGTEGVTAPLIDVGKGTAEDYAKAGEVRGTFVLIHTDILDDAAGLGGLFAEYTQSYHAKTRAVAAGAMGVIYVSSRPNGLMMRHVASQGWGNEIISATIDRENALLAQQAMANGEAMMMTVKIDATEIKGGLSYNVFVEIEGSERPEEIVLIGAHMDSHDLGTGALDNGTNTTMIMDIARQIKALGVAPKRTIRFALWNAEEYGLLGSQAYVAYNIHKMDNHIVTITHDIGGGRITGYFVNGGPHLKEETDTALGLIKGRGPFENIVAPLVGTDNYDFMMVGVPNLVAAQDAATYPSNYHASSDTFDKVDQAQLRKNAAIAAHTLWYFANSDWRGRRATPAEIAKMVKDNDLEPAMDGFGLLADWRKGKRGFNPNPTK